MNLKFIRKLPTPIELKQMLPVGNEIIRIKQKKDEEIKDIITGKSKKFLVIVGPCSAHDAEAVLDYVKRLSKIQERVKEEILIIPRVYTNKPRTNASGYKGLLHQPNPSDLPNFLEGLKTMRKLHIDVISETGLTAADEILYPESFRYVSDLISYSAVGARSVENQFHRLVASGLDIACGMKNPTSGDFKILINSIRAAHDYHSFIYRGWEVQSRGNELTHAILRGATGFDGKDISNYGKIYLDKLYDMYSKENLKNKSVIIDVNHANSGKNYKKQVKIVNEVIDIKLCNTIYKNFIKGVMIESFIEEGCQKVEEGVYGKSITDPCLGWNDTERLIYTIAEKLC